MVVTILPDLRLSACSVKDNNLVVKRFRHIKVDTPEAVALVGERDEPSPVLLEQTARPRKSQHLVTSYLRVRHDQRDIGPFALVGIGYTALEYDILECVCPERGILRTVLPAVADKIFIDRDFSAALSGGSGRESHRPAPPFPADGLPATAEFK
jgi:hypothetical protein